MTLPISKEAGSPASSLRHSAKPGRRECGFPQNRPRGSADLRLRLGGCASKFIPPEINYDSATRRSSATIRHCRSRSSRCRNPCLCQAS